MKARSIEYPSEVAKQLDQEGEERSNETRIAQRKRGINLSLRIDFRITEFKNK